MVMMAMFSPLWPTTITIITIFVDLMVVMVMVITTITTMFVDYTQMWITPQTFEIETTFVALKRTKNVSFRPILGDFLGLLFVRVGGGANLNLVNQAF